MRCNGKTLIFEGQPNRNGKRVQVSYQTQILQCNKMGIELNRQVMFFDDQSPIEPKAVEIQCSGNVDVQNQQIDAQGKRKSIDFARAARLFYAVEKNYIAAEGPGEMSSIFIGSGQGFDSNNLAGTPVSSGTSGNTETLNHFAVSFQDTMQGTLLGNNREIEITGRVKAIYCPAAGWEDRIGLDNFGAARKTGYTLECERLHLAEAPNPVNLSQSSMELTASTNAIIDGSGIFGKAQTIRYNQAKSMVYLDDNVRLTIPGQGEISAGSIHYNIKTRAIEQMRAKGFSIGQ